MKDQYDDIINLPHHVSKTRPQMSMLDRAAQFSPFAALTGYDAAIKETGRLTDEKVNLSEEEKEALDRKQQILLEKLADHPALTVIFFVPDEKKEGGRYEQAEGTIKKIDEIAKVIVTDRGERIPIENIVELSE